MKENFAEINIMKSKNRSVTGCAKLSGIAP